MKTRVTAFLAAIVFMLSLAGVAFAVDVKGTVTKIEITVKDSSGKETKVEVNSTAAVKKGDKVDITNGNLKKASAY